jgi:hypothetical protein
LAGRADPSGIWHSFPIIQVEEWRLRCHDEETVDGSAKYELLQRIAGDKIVAYRGRQTANGQIVLLHQLGGTNDHTDVLSLAVQYLLRNPASAGGRIQDMVEIQGLRYLVTLDQPECLALREWLRWELEGAKPAPVAYTAPPPSRDPGEFTRLFQQQQVGSAVPPVQPPPAAPATPAEASAPGEFTQLFGRGGRSQPSEPAPKATPAPVMPAPLASEKQQPGEFTRLFRSPLATPAESPMNSLPSAASSPRAPGEFTRIFGGGTAPGASAPIAPSPASAPPPAPAWAPGPLTESLDPRHQPTNKPDMTPSGPAPGPGEFTRVIHGSAGSGTVPPPAPPLPAPAPAMQIPVSVSTPSLPSTPSMPSASPPSLPTPPSMPSVSVAAPPSPAAASTPGRPSTAVIILFVVLIVAALALIGFVVLRR